MDLEEEKRKHAEDTAEGDDVTYILEKERERLQQQVRCCSTCHLLENFFLSLSSKKTFWQLFFLHVLNIFIKFF